MRVAGAPDEAGDFEGKNYSCILKDPNTGCPTVASSAKGLASVISTRKDKIDFCLEIEHLAPGFEYFYGLGSHGLMGFY